MTGRGGCRIALVEDHLLFAESLEIALSMEGNEVRRIPLTGNTRSVITLLPQVLRVRPRIVLLDLDLGAHGNGAQLIEPLSRAGVAVIVVTGNADKVQWGECLRYGARTVLPKTSRLNEILAAVRRINNGLPVVKPEEREELHPAVAHPSGGRARAAQPPRATHAPGAGSARASDARSPGPGDRHPQCGVGGHRAHPGEVDPGEARGRIPARCSRCRPPSRMASAASTAQLQGRLAELGYATPRCPELP